MPDDKNVKLMLFCSHCLRRCATFATCLDDHCYWLETTSSTSGSCIISPILSPSFCPLPTERLQISSLFLPALSALSCSLLFPLPPKTSHFVRKPVLYRSTGFCALVCTLPAIESLQVSASSFRCLILFKCRTMARR